jgi:hypothetical protein
MAAFPRLRTGAVAQYPSKKEIGFDTTVARFIDGTEQRFRRKGPARRWEIRLSAVTAEEMAAIEDFFNSHQGRFGSFAFTDPWDDSEHPDCSFDHDQLDVRILSESQATARLIIRTNQV